MPESIGIVVAILGLGARQVRVYTGQMICVSCKSRAYAWSPWSPLCFASLLVLFYVQYAILSWFLNHSHKKLTIAPIIISSDFLNKHDSDSTGQPFNNLFPDSIVYVAKARARLLRCAPYI